MTGKEVYNLIKGLDTTTRKNFKRYCNTSNTTSNWLYLYHQIVKAKYYDEDKIRGKRLKGRNDFWAARMHLLQQLITSMYLWRQNDDCLEDDRLLIARDLGMYDFLAKQLKKEFKKATSEGKVWRIMELEEIRESLRVIPSIKTHEIFTDEAVVAALEDVREIAACKRNLSRYRIFMKTGTNDQLGREMLADELVIDLYRFPSKSPQVLAFQLRVLVREAMLRTRLDVFAKRQEELVELLLSARETTDLSILISEVTTLIKVLITVDSDVQARKYLRLMRGLEAQTPFERKLKKRMVAATGISLSVVQYDLDLFKISLELVEEDQERVVYFLISGATLAFYCADHTYCIKMLNSVLNMRKEDWLQYAWYLKPLEALVRYDKGDFDEAERLISRIKSNSSIECAYSELILSTLTALMKSLPGERNEVITSAYNSYLVYAETGEGKSKVAKFDFGAWLLSKIKGIPIPEIFRIQQTKQPSFPNKVAKSE